MTAIDAAIGNRLRALRQARALTLDQVAAQVGVRAQQVQKYETGQNRISAGRLLDFARLFQVPLGSFFESLELAGADGGAEPSDGRSLQLAHEFDKLPEPQKRAVLSLVLSLAGMPEDKGKPYGT
jgi:transcriptional regulator with XRE-family HTH domain